MSDKTYCLKHYRQTFPNKGCDMCEQDRAIADLKIMRQDLEDANIAGTFRCAELQERIAALEAEKESQRVFLLSLTGSLWPQNETTQMLADYLEVGK